MRVLEGAAVLALIVVTGCASGPGTTAALAPSSADVSWFFDPEVDEEGRYLDPMSWPWVEGRANFGGRDYAFVVRDSRRRGDGGDLSRVQIVFDRDGDGCFDADETTGEGYRGNVKFNLGTGTFRIASVTEDGSRISFEPVWPGTDVRPFLGVGDPAPPLPPRDLEGRPLSWEQFRGRKVLLVFWSST